MNIYDSSLNGGFKFPYSIIKNEKLKRILWIIFSVWAISPLIIDIIEFPDTIIKSIKLKKILRITFSILSILAFLTFTTLDFSVFITTILTFALSGLIVVLLLSSRYYNWSIILFMVVFIGLYYKREHWPYAAILMTLGTVVLALVSWFNSFKFFYAFRNNTFLKWIGFLTGIIVILFMMGFLFMNLHWSGHIRVILIESGCFLFVFSVLGLVFTLPSSNYVAWSDIERKVFFRTVLTPLVFIFALFTLVIVFNDVYNSLAGRGFVIPPWYLRHFELYKLEGISTL